MLKKIAIGLLVVVLLVVGAAAMRDGKYAVERQRLINAPVGKVFPLLSDLRHFQEWSPWEKLDPTMQKTVDEKSYSWKGNDKVGEGKMTETGITPDQAVNIHLQFLKPFASESDVVWSVKPEGADKTIVTWSMKGEEKSLVPKMFGMLFSMDKIIGPDFERGLENLQKVAEKN